MESGECPPTTSIDWCRGSSGHEVSPRERSSHNTNLLRVWFTKPTSWNDGSIAGFQDKLFARDEIILKDNPEFGGESMKGFPFSQNEERRKSISESSSIYWDDMIPRRSSSLNDRFHVADDKIDDRFIQSNEPTRKVLKEISVEDLQMLISQEPNEDRTSVLEMLGASKHHITRTNHLTQATQRSDTTLRSQTKDSNRHINENQASISSLTESLKTKPNNRHKHQVSNLSSSLPDPEAHISRQNIGPPFTTAVVPPFNPNFPLVEVGAGDNTPSAPFDPFFRAPQKPRPFETEVGGICIIADGVRGYCVQLRDCPPLRPLLDQLQDAVIVRLLFTSVCRFEPGQFHVCCEFPAFDPWPVGVVDMQHPALKRSPHVAPLPPLGECGRRKRARGKILHGKESQENEWPWLAAVGRPVSDNAFLEVCSGSLISRRHVLTAAACFLERQYFQPSHVRLGDHSTRKREKSLHEDFTIVARNDPGYVVITDQNNLMVLTLERDVRFVGHILPACLPSPGEEGPLEGSPVTLLGWERTVAGSVPTYVTQPVIDNQHCQSETARSRSELAVIDHRKICVRRNGINGTTCGSDAGGPIMQQGVNSSYSLVGVITTLTECNATDVSFGPTVGTKLAPYIEWVRYVIQDPSR